MAHQQPVRASVQAPYVDMPHAVSVSSLMTG